jgi:hypothetical protein
MEVMMMSNGNGSDQVLLQELTADLALATQQGLSVDSADPADSSRGSWSPRFCCEVTDYNQFIVTDSDDQQYVVTVAAREES